MRARALAMAMLAAMMVGWVAPAAAQAPADTLVVTRLSDFPTCFHPICFQTGNQYMDFQLLFNSLVKVEPDESTFIPDLADTWDVSPDATTFTFHLNPDAKWHDGTPVTADDVVYTAATAAQMADAYIGTYPITNWLAVEGAADVLGTTDVPTGITKVDDHTVKFTLAAPNAVWLRNLTDPAYMIMPKHLLEGMTADELKASDFVNGRGTVGSGPYKLVTFTPEVSIEYEANADYYKGAPNIPKVIFKLNVDPSTAAAQLQSGELQMAFELEPSDFDVLDGVAGINVEQVPGVGQQTLQFPVPNPQVNDPRVRQAINYAFDRKTLLETVFQGAGKLLWIGRRLRSGRPRPRPLRLQPGQGQGAHRGGRRRRQVRSDQAPPRHLLPRAGGLERDRRSAPERPDQSGILAELQPTDAAGWDGHPAERQRLRDQPPVLRIPDLYPEGVGHLQQRVAGGYAVRELRPGRAVPRRPGHRGCGRAGRDLRADRRRSSTRTCRTTGCGPSRTPTPTRRASATSRTTRTRASRSRRSRSGRWRRSLGLRAPLDPTDGVVIGPSRGTLTLLSEEPMG